MTLVRWYMVREEYFKIARDSLFNKTEQKGTNKLLLLLTPAKSMPLKHAGHANTSYGNTAPFCIEMAEYFARDMPLIASTT